MGGSRGPSLSISFNVRLGRTFNLFYSTTPLDSTDLPDPVKSNEMATLMSVSVLTEETNQPGEDLQERGPVITKKKKKHGI